MAKTKTKNKIKPKKKHVFKDPSIEEVVEMEIEVKDPATGKLIKQKVKVKRLKYVKREEKPFIGSSSLEDTLDSDDSLPETDVEVED